MLCSCQYYKPIAIKNKDDDLVNLYLKTNLWVLSEGNTIGLNEKL